MANSYGLNLYSIRLTKRYDSKKEYILSDFGAKQDLLNVIEDMFNSWKFEARSSKSSDGGNAGPNDIQILKVDEEKVVRIKQNTDGSFCLNRIGRMLDGVIMYGEAGTSEPVVNVQNGKFRYTKKKDDAPLKPFFFKFYIPENALVGFFIVENIGSSGISSIIQRKLLNFYKKKDNDAVLKIQPIGISELADSALEKSQGVKKIILRGISNSNFNLSQLAGDNVTNKDCTIDYVIKAKGSLFQKRLFNKLRSTKNETTSLYEIDGNNFADISVTMNIDGRERTLSVGQFSKLGTSIDITDKIKKGEDGYPTYKSLDEQAMILISLINKQYGIK